MKFCFTLVQLELTSIRDIDLQKVEKELKVPIQILLRLWGMR